MMLEKDIKKYVDMIQQGVDKLDKTFSKHFFDEIETIDDGNLVSTLMTTCIYTFCHITIKKMADCGLKKSEDKVQYFEFFKEQINYILSKMIDEAKNGKED